MQFRTRRRVSIERRSKMNSFRMSAAITWIVCLQVNAAFDAAMPGGCKSRNLSVTVDDFLRLFIDGREITGLINAKNWQNPDTVELPCNARVIAIEGNDTGGVGAMLASTDDGYIITNSSWKCTNTNIQGWETIDFNDSSWSNAVFVSDHEPFPNTTANITRNDAHWIWTQGFEGQDLNVFCRIKLDVDECSFDQTINECDPLMGRCVNIPTKGYNCSCYPGYTNDGQHKCKDDNECVNGTHICSDECFNTNGSYECGCPKGHRLKLDNQTCEAQDVLIEVVGKVPLTAATSVLSLLLLPALIVPIVVVQRRRRKMMKQNCMVQETPKDEVPAVDNATYEELEMSDVNGAKNHIYEPVMKTPHCQADNATYEGLDRSNVDAIDSDTYESL